MATQFSSTASQKALCLAMCPCISNFLFLTLDTDTCGAAVINNSRGGVKHGHIHLHIPSFTFLLDVAMTTFSCLLILMIINQDSGSERCHLLQSLPTWSWRAPLLFFHFPIRLEDKSVPRHKKGVSVLFTPLPTSVLSLPGITEIVVYGYFVLVFQAHSQGGGGGIRGFCTGTPSTQLAISSNHYQLKC